MVTELGFDKATLLAPLSEDAPTGRDLREDESWDSLYRVIKEDARKTAMRIERKAEEMGEEPIDHLPHWFTVRDKGFEALAQHSKDLEIAAFVLEALPRTDGFAGLAFGLELTAELIEQYWFDLHYPRLEDTPSLGDKLLPFERLNEGLLTAPLRQIRITEGRDEGPFAYWHYQQAVALGQVSDDEREERIRRGAVTMERFERSVRDTPPAFYQQLVSEIEQCLVQLERVDRALHDKLAEEGQEAYAPSFASIREALEDVLRTVRAVAKDHLASTAPASAAEPGGTAPAAATTTSGAPEAASPFGPLQTREDAFRQLLAIAEFFERTEPQSLLPPQIRQVVRRGRLRPEELLSELIDDESTRDQLFRFVGMNRPKSESEESY